MGTGGLESAPGKPRVKEGDVTPVFVHGSENTALIRVTHRVWARPIIFLSQREGASPPGFD